LPKVSGSVPLTLGLLFRFLHPGETVRKLDYLNLKIGANGSSLTTTTLAAMENKPIRGASNFAPLK
jgi:hypothetical protein